MKPILFLMLAIVPSLASAQCLECQQLQVRSFQVVERQAPVQVAAVEYMSVDVVHEYRVRQPMRRVNVVGEFDVQCAIQAGQVFVQSKSEGNRFLRAALDAGMEYLTCSGGFSLRSDGRGQPRFGFFRKLRAGMKVRRSQR
jgi:hypothetical protein